MTTTPHNSTTSTGDGCKAARPHRLAGMSSDQAYQDGFDAFKAGEPMDSNPHPLTNAYGLTNYDHWNIGYIDAKKWGRK